MPPKIENKILVCRFCGNNFTPTDKQFSNRKYREYICSKICKKNESWSKVVKCFENNFIKGAENQCWEWQKSKICGYGSISYRDLKGRIYYRAPRFSYFLYKGEIPKNMLVCHLCDNPPCVNPNHLFLSTTDDNIADKINKNRHLRGSQMPNAVLNEDKVKAIRKEYVKKKGEGKRLAEKYGTTYYQISAVINNKSWRHVK